jgi:hypothetical protein
MCSSNPIIHDSIELPERSLATFQAVFVPYSEGGPRAHVYLSREIISKNLFHTDEHGQKWDLQLLSPAAMTTNEFISHINTLIHELEILKAWGKQQFDHDCEAFTRHQD